MSRRLTAGDEGQLQISPTLSRTAFVERHRPDFDASDSISDRMPEDALNNEKPEKEEQSKSSVRRWLASSTSQMPISSARNHMKAAKIFREQQVIALRADNGHVSLRPSSGWTPWRRGHGQTHGSSPTTTGQTLGRVTILNHSHSWHCITHVHATIEDGTIIVRTKALH